MVQGYPQSTLLAVAAPRTKDKGGPTLSSVPTLRYLPYTLFWDTIRSACGSNGSHVFYVRIRFSSQWESLSLSFVLSPLCASAFSSLFFSSRSLLVRVSLSTRSPFRLLSSVPPPSIFSMLLCLPFLAFADVLSYSLSLSLSLCHCAILSLFWNVFRKASSSCKLSTSVYLVLKHSRTSLRRFDFRLFFIKFFTFDCCSIEQ